MACGRRALQRVRVKHGQHSCSDPCVLSGDLGVCGSHRRRPAAVHAQHCLPRCQLHHSQQFHDGAVDARVEQPKPLSDHVWRYGGMDAGLTSEEESQSGFSFKVIIVFLSYCGPSCMHGALLHGLGPTLRGIRSTCFAQGSSMKSLLVLCRDTCFLCTGVLCLVTVAWTTKDCFKKTLPPRSD